MAKTPKQIYAILAYSPSLNNTKRIFDEDSLTAPYKHTVDRAVADQKANAFAALLNQQQHKGATDWQARPQLQDYKPTGLVRASQICAPSHSGR